MFLHSHSLFFLFFYTTKIPPLRSCHVSLFFFLLTSYPLTHIPIFNLSSSVTPSFPLFLPTNSLFSLTNPFTFPLNHFTLFPNATFSYTHHNRTLTFRLQTSFHACFDTSAFIYYSWPHDPWIDTVTRFAPKITTFIKMDREEGEIPKQYREHHLHRTHRRLHHPPHNTHYHHSYLHFFYLSCSDNQDTLRTHSSDIFLLPLR